MLDEVLDPALPGVRVADAVLVLRVHHQVERLAGVKQGLDELDRNFLSTIIRLYKGGPVGVEAISATLNEEVDTLVDMVEPYLLQLGFVSRTKSGRMANEPAYKHLKMSAPGRTQTLFD